ncbi:MAG: hypothetical protein KY463_05655 [Actinobacteria bacterium]|nr:hypothetical protein [Actinomycetota bacterium]
MLVELAAGSVDLLARLRIVGKRLRLVDELAELFIRDTAPRGFGEGVVALAERAEREALGED